MTPLQVLKRTITSCETFEDLGIALSSCTNSLLYEEVQSKIASLQIEFCPNLIWALCSAAREHKESPDTYWTLLEMYCNRLVAEGLLNSDSVALWESIEGNPYINPIPVVVLMCTVDRKDIDMKYLAETASAISNYEYPYNEYAPDDTQFILKDIFTNSGKQSFGDITRNMTMPSPDKTNWYQGLVDTINIVTNRDAKLDFIANLYDQHNYDYMNEHLSRNSTIVLTYFKNRANEGSRDLIDADDIKTWITYFMASMQQITRRIIASGDGLDSTQMSTGLQQAMTCEYVAAFDTVSGQFPEVSPKTLKYEVINQCADYAHICIEKFHLLSELQCDLLRNKIACRFNPMGEIILPMGLNPKKINLSVPHDETTEIVTEAKSISDVKKKSAQPKPDEYIEPDDEADTEDTENEENTPDDKEIRRMNRDNNAKQTKGGYDKSSSVMDKAGRKIYKGFRAYKDAEAKVDSQVSKLTLAVKSKYRQGIRDEIVEGKRFSVIQILKKVMTTAAIFSYSKIAGLLFVIVRKVTHDKVSNKERYEIMQELQMEIKMLEEKIEDARGDGNRQAKYSMMRTKAELEKAYNQIRYGMKSNRSTKAIASKLTRGRLDTSYNPSRGGDDL